MTFSALIPDYLVLVRGVDVFHLMHDGRTAPHVPTDGVRLAEDALVYDLGVTPPLPAIQSDTLVQSGVKQTDRGAIVSWMRTWRSSKAMPSGEPTLGPNCIHTCPAFA
jgi:hypothetical protein